MNDRKTTREQWLDAYDDMMVRVKTAFEEAEEATLPKLQEFIHDARDKAVELEELTRDEAEKIAGYLERDLQPIIPAWNCCSSSTTSRKDPPGTPAKLPARVRWNAHPAMPTSISMQRVISRNAPTAGIRCITARSCRSSCMATRWPETRSPRAVRQGGRTSWAYCLLACLAPGIPGQSLADAV
jgi:hypothetical protein